MTPPVFARSGPVVVHGLGLVVFDQQVYVAEHPAPDTKVFAQGHRSQIGGPVPTALAQLRRLGVDCRILGSWADDSAGREIERDFTRTGIAFDLSACRTSTSSGFAHVWVESGTGRRTVVSVPPTGKPVRDAAAAFARTASVLHLDGWGGESAIVAADAARSAGAVVTLDAGSVKPTTDRLLPLVDVLNAPMQFIRAYCGTHDAKKGADHLLDLGPRLVTVTDGDRGAGVYTGDIAEWLPAYAVRAVDTCGAGDVFCGGLTYALTTGHDPVASLRFAMATAALKVTRPGNRDALPSLAEIESLATSPA